MKISNSWPHVIFVLFIICIFFYWNFDEIIKLRPCGQHQWRQCDSGSLALNYHQFDNSLFRPEIHQQFEKNGRTVGEFPIINYLASLLYDVFGFHEFLFRGLNYLIFVLGLFYLFKIGLIIFNDIIYALFLVSLSLLSPIVNFYSITFMPDTSGMAFSYIGLYFLILYNRGGENKQLILSILFFSLTALVKITHLLPLIVFICTAFLSFLPVFKSTTIDIFKCFNQKKSLYFSIIPLLVGLWLAYANYYKNLNDNFYFGTRAFPIWKASSKKFDFILERMTADWGWYPDLMHEYLLYLFLGLLLLTFFIKEHILRIPVILYLLGVLAFLALFGRKLDHHDYYLIVIAPFVVHVFGVILYRLSQLKSNTAQYVIKAFCIGIIIFNLQYNKNRLNEKYFNFKWDDKFEAFMDFEKELVKHEIGLDKKVYIVHDETFDVGLYLMNRKGWNNAELIPEEVQLQKTKGAEYLIIIDALPEDKIVLDKLKLEFVFDYKNLRTYRM